MKFTRLLMATALSLSLVSCLDSGDETIALSQKTETIGSGNATEVVSSDEYSVLSREGYRLTIPVGAVPRNSLDNAGRVAFSITPVEEEELPISLPSSVMLADGIPAVKIEPMGFRFFSPLVLEFNTLNHPIDKLALLRYNENSGHWDTVPLSRWENGIAASSVIELGVFCVVTYTETLQTGGIRVRDTSLAEDGCYYLMARRGSEQYKMAFSSNSRPLYMANLPLGTYTVQVARQVRSGLDEEEGATFYTRPFEVNVRNVLAVDGRDFESYVGWTDIDLSHLTWSDGRPESWGTPTVTYGTGKLQATLTWTNVSGNTTDYDLHLFGPDGIHVYYSNKNQSGFELDRDWLEQTGSAIENIYTVSDNVLQGEYQIKVHHYGGATGKRYNCRVILDGMVIKSVSGVVDSGFDDICSFQISSDGGDH